jgi:stage II sporulation protein GA (sporulation sigma-E factor processing peptidase)
MDAALLCAALRWCGRPIVPWRVGAAALLGAVYAAAAWTPALAALRTPVCAAPACAAMLWLAARWQGPVQFLRAVPAFFCAAFLAGGIVYALAQALGGLSPAWELGLAGAAALSVPLRRGVRRARQRQGLHARVRVRLRGVSAELDGLVDSGNLLLEPLSGLPVLVASHASVRALLPALCDPRRLETLPRGFRLVRVVSAGGERMLMCFRPEELCLREGARWRPVLAMVAVSPQALPEGVLIPAVLTA